MSRSIEPYVLTNENAPAFWSLGTLWLPLSTGVLTGNSLTLIEQQMPAQSGPSSHLHTQEEGFYILSGSCTFQVGGETIHATPGTLLHIPRDTSHSFETQEPTHALNFYVLSSGHAPVSCGRNHGSRNAAKSRSFDAYFNPCLLQRPQEQRQAKRQLKPPSSRVTPKALST